MQILKKQRHSFTENIVIALTLCFRLNSEVFPLFIQLIAALLPHNMPSYFSYILSLMISTRLMTRTESNPQIYELYNLSGAAHSFRWPKRTPSLPQTKPMMSSDWHWAGRQVSVRGEGGWGITCVADTA